MRDDNSLNLRRNIRWNCPQIKLNGTFQLLEDSVNDAVPVSNPLHPSMTALPLQPNIHNY